MRRSACMEFILSMLREINSGHGYRTKTNPSIPFVRKAKAGKYDRLDDNDYNILLAETEELAKHWQNKSEVSYLDLLKSLLENITIPEGILEQIAEQLCICYEDVIGKFDCELQHPEYLTNFPSDNTMQNRHNCSTRPIPQPPYNSLVNNIQSPKEVYEYLTKHIHGQRDACRAAAMLLYNHSNGRRRNILFAGPTGCGKTEIWRVCRQLYSNIIIVDASRITAEGWTGSFKIHDIFTGLTASEIEKSIVVLDEFDKLCEPKYSSGGNNYSYLEQNNLLTLIEGGQITFPAENGKPAIAFDSSRLSFVFLGSFEILTEKKTVKKSESTIGFHAAPQKPDAYHMYTQKITQDDLIQYAGMRREIAGRINQIVQLGPMTAQDYEVILHDEEISPIQKLERQYNIRLHIDEADCRQLSTEAAENKMGVRYLHSRLQEMLDECMFHDCQRQEYTLHADTSENTVISASQ